MGLKGLKDFPEIQALETFDFRDLMWNYYQYYYEKFPRGRQGNKAYEDILNGAKEMMGEKDPAEKWYLYKTLDKGQRIQFDCDNSSTTCQLAAEIYMTLWDEDIHAYCEKAGTPAGERDVTLVGETMNSILTTLNELAKKLKGQRRWSWARWKDLHETAPEEFKEIFDKCPEAREFIAVAHTIGNFLPWPAGCNGPRGTGPVKDYWDLTLKCIYLWYQENKEWLKEGPRLPQNGKIVGLFDSQMANFDQYLATFGTWDMFVEENYMAPFVHLITDSRHQELVEELGIDEIEGCYGLPKELWEGHFSGQVLPQKKEQIEVFFKRATERILARGELMVAALRKKEKEDK